ncbi:hypothetical protein ACX80J_14100 [Arthrobacter sp. MDB2-24]
MLLALEFTTRSSLAFVVAGFFDVSFARYAVVMIPVGMVSVAVRLGGLLLFFH